MYQNAINLEGHHYSP